MTAADTAELEPPRDAARTLRDEVASLHGASWGWAMRLCRRDRALAEDVLQIVYEAVLRGAARWDGRSTFKTWLFGVVRITAMRERRRRWFGALVGAAPSREPATRDSKAPEAAASLSERARVVQGALAVLPARQREVVHLVFYEGLSIAEAAAVMRVSLGSARQHYERGKKRLWEQLRAKGVEP